MADGRERKTGELALHPFNTAGHLQLLIERMEILGFWADEHDREDLAHIAYPWHAAVEQRGSCVLLVGTGLRLDKKARIEQDMRALEVGSGCCQSNYSTAL